MRGDGGSLVDFSRPISPRLQAAQLIYMQRRQLRRDEIRCLRDEEADARIVERPLATHLAYAHVGVPIRNRPIRTEGLESYAFQAVDRRETIGSEGVFSDRRFVPSNAWWRGSYCPGPRR